MLTFFAAVIAALTGFAQPVPAAPLTCAAQTASLRLCKARTDNYKDCYNTADDLRELRSWLAFTGLRARGVSWWLPTSTEQFPVTVTVRRQKKVPKRKRKLPRTATLQFTVTSGDASTIARHGPPTGMWGPLLTLGSSTSHATSPVVVEAKLIRPSGGLLGTTTLSYTRVDALWNALASSPEHNGPGGRWYVGGHSTPTDVELGTPHSC
jgi:hypothetical protein